MEQAGFFSTSGDRSRLIKPSIASTPNAPALPLQNAGQTQHKADPVTQERHRVGGGGGGVDTAIIGLLRKLPAQGETWTNAEQTRFLTAFTHTIQFLYPTVASPIKSSIA